MQIARPLQRRQHFRTEPPRLGQDRIGQIRRRLGKPLGRLHRAEARHMGQQEPEFLDWSAIGHGVLSSRLGIRPFRA
jgi:hypothetical protein